MALETEMATYDKQLQALLAEDGEGKFALIQGDEVISVYATYEDAVKAGYHMFGVDTRFLVKQILAVEQVYSFTRDIASCHI